MGEGPPPHDCALENNNNNNNMYACFALSTHLVSVSSLANPLSGKLTRQADPAHKKYAHFVYVVVVFNFATPLPTNQPDLLAPPPPCDQARTSNDEETITMA